MKRCPLGTFQKITSRFEWCKNPPLQQLLNVPISRIELLIAPWCLEQGWGPKEDPLPYIEHFLEARLYIGLYKEGYIFRQSEIGHSPNIAAIS